MLQDTYHSSYYIQQAQKELDTLDLSMEVFTRATQIRHADRVKNNIYYRSSIGFNTRA